MKFAFSTATFRLRPLCEAIEGIGRAGFGAVELVADKPHAYPEDLTAPEITSLNKCLEEQKVKICSLDSSIVSALGGDPPGPSWIEEDWQTREKRIRFTLDCMRLAAAMGVPHVSSLAGGPIPPTMNRFDAVRLLVANMHRVLPLAQKLGVQLLIRTDPGMLVETSDQMLDLLKEMSFPDALRVNFDVGHLFCAGEDPCEAWDKLKKYTAHVHLEDIPADRQHRHVQLGEGAVDIPRFLQCVKDSGYDEYVTIRLESFDQRGEELAMASARYLETIGFPLKRAEALP